MRWSTWLRHARRRGGIIAILACLSLATLYPLVASASMRRLSDEELVSASSRIVEGRVLEMHSEWNAAHNQIHTTIIIALTQVYKGAMPPDHRLVIDQLGGQVGDTAMDITDQPEFATGEEVIVFLRATPSLTSPVAGLEQGKLTIVTDPTTGAPMVRERAVSRASFTQELSRVIAEQERGGNR